RRAPRAGLRDVRARRGWSVSRHGARVGGVPAAGRARRRTGLDGSESQRWCDGAIHGAGDRRRPARDAGPFGVVMTGEVPAHDGTILIVDDRPENLVALRAVLEPLGHPVAEAAS